MPQSHPRFGRGLSAGRRLLFITLFLSFVLALAYGPSGRAQNAPDQQQDKPAEAPAVIVPGISSEPSGQRRRQLPVPEGDAAPSKETPEAAVAQITAAEAADVTWRAADGPRVINGTYTIPAGTTVTVEPGVLIQINQNSVLVVEGAIVGKGTPDRHITITGVSDYTSDIQVPGRFQFEYTDISAQSDPRSGGTYTCSNCRYTGNGGFSNGLGYTYAMPPYVELQHTTFDGSGSTLTLDTTTTVLRDVAFTGGAWGRIYYSYVYIDNVRSENSTGFGLQFGLDGRWYLNNVQVRNAAFAALDLGGGNGGGNYLLGPNTVLSGSQYPISLDWGGVLPGSNVPASGNTNNYIVANTPGHPDWGGSMVWAPQAVPYVVLFPMNLRGGELKILPGTNVKFGPNFAGISDQSLGLIARGTPSAPILFDRFDPAQAWGGIGNTVGGNRYSNVRIEGSLNGINTTVHNGAFAYVEDLDLRDNQTGASGGTFISGTRFFNNTTGYQESGASAHTVGMLNASPASPNSFEGNGVAARGTQSVIDARGNWWNSPTGPTYVGNPGGTGERVEGAAEVIPFLTAPPDYTDAPPVVRQHKPHFTYEAGTKLDITWDAEDDRAVVEHRILFNPDGNWPDDFQLVADGLPGSVRAYEWTVPAVGYAGGYGYSTVRVVAVDSAGHERFDDRFIQIPSGEVTGTLTLTSNYAGQTLRPGQEFAVTFEATGDARSSIVDAYLVLDNDGTISSLGGVAGSLGQLPYAKLPFVSTDRARLALRINGGRNRTRWFYGDYFQIRPDPRVGDAAPNVSVVSPSAGSSFPAGSDVQVSWAASDDEGLNSFKLFSSYDAGRSWNLVAEDLPATTGSYNFKTAAGPGFSDVRVRVVAVDRRFQQTAAETSFALTPTAPPNAPPVVRLERPTADSAYAAGTTLNLTATASDPDGSVSKVEFFAGGTLVGTDTTAPYDVTWQNVPAGTYTIVARATDNVGKQKNSVGVNVTVYAEPPAASPVAGAAWGARYNSPASRAEVSPILTLDAAGNTYVTAASDGIGSGQDIVTVKYDAAGRQLWAARYGNPDRRVEYPEDIAVDSAGNVYVTGTAWRGLAPGTDYDVITIKYDSSGNQQWVRFYATASQEFGVALEADGAGNVYVTGSGRFIGADGFPAGQFVTLKYDPAGNVVWTRTYNGPDGRGAVPVDLKLDAAGNVYVAGAVTALTASGATDDDLAVVKYDPAGNLLRAVKYDTPGTNGQDFDTAVRLRVAAGGVYLIAQSWPDQCCAVTESRYDSILLKFDSELGLSWAARWGLPGQSSENPSDLVTDGDGNVYVVGTAGSTQRAGDAYTLKYSAAGQLLWQRIYEGTTYQDAAAVGVALDPAGGVQVGISGLGPNDNYDYILVRYLADGTQSSVRQFNGPANRDDALSDIETDAAGNVYLTGTTFTASSGTDLFTLKVAAGGSVTPTPTPTPIPSPTPTPAATLVNHALASNGGVAAASSSYSANYPASSVNNGDRRGLNWNSGGGWNDATADSYPDWVEVSFPGWRSVSEVSVFTLQDSPATPSDPTEAMTFTKYGATSFRVQYWDGTAWADVPGGVVASNDKVWKRLAFAAVATSKVRVLLTGALAGYSRLTEVEAWGLAGEAQPPAARVNHALASNGGVATSSSAYSNNYPAASVNNGDRRGLSWNAGGGWNDATANSYPDWVEVAFAGPRAVEEVSVFTLQDAPGAPLEPTEAMTFTKYGVTGFRVEYWDGSAWQTAANGSVTGNDRVWRRVTFPAVTTTKVRVVVTGALADYSRITEVEAWGPAAPRVNQALASGGATATASSSYSSNYPAASVINGDRRGLNWNSGGGWNDSTGGAYPDWVEVTFPSAKSLTEVDVFTLQDAPGAPLEPTEAMTFTKYGVTAFEVQYWDGGAWLPIPGASAIGNSKVWNRFTFPALTTTKIRLVVNGALADYSRLTEIEAY
ncbi:MAG: SBBP repeat-containing protein [Acidobacteria bacterium]|nr:SBBP repeat-containing protein [Acidobacteriota bacterium]